MVMVASSNTPRRGKVFSKYAGTGGAGGDARCRLKSCAVVGGAKEAWRARLRGGEGRAEVGMEAVPTSGTWMRRDARGGSEGERRRWWSVDQAPMVTVESAVVGVEVDTEAAAETEEYTSAS
jgi:hypothetical protein